MGLFGPNIAKMKKKEDLPGLIGALGNNKPEVRKEGAEALIGLAGSGNAGAIAGAGAVSTFVRMLEDGDAEFRLLAVRALGALGDSAAAGSLDEIIEEGKEDAKIILAAKNSLKQIKVANAGSVRRLVKYLKFRDETYRLLAVNALVERFRKDDDKKIFIINGGIRAIVQVLKVKNANVRREAADALAIFAEEGEAKAVVDAGGVKKLLESIRSPEMDVQRAAAFALGKISDAGEARSEIIAHRIPEFIESLTGIKVEMAECPDCGATIPMSATICPGCGVEFDE